MSVHKRAAVYRQFGWYRRSIAFVPLQGQRLFLLHRKFRSLCNKKLSGGSHCGGKEDRPQGISGVWKLRENVDPKDNEDIK